MTILINAERARPVHLKTESIIKLFNAGIEMV